MSKISAVALTCISDDYHYMIHDSITRNKKSSTAKRDSNSKNQANKDWEKVCAVWSNDAD